MVHSSEDSLSSYFTLANDDNLTFQKKQEYNQKAFAIVMNQPNDSMFRVNLVRVANRYYNMNDWVSYGNTVHVLLDKSEKAKDTLNIAKANSFLGDYYGGKAVSDSAYFYYFKAEKMFVKLDDSYNLARTRLNKGLLQYSESDLLGSENAVINALRAIKGEKVSDLEYEAYNLLGLINNELEEFDKSIEYHNKALESIDDDVIPVQFQSKATSLNNIGLVYQNRNKYKEAIRYYKQGLSQKNLLKDKPSVYAMLLDNMGYSKLKTNDINGLPELFYESLKLRDSLNHITGIIVNEIHLSEYFAYKKDTIKALEFCNEALVTARNSRINRNALEPLKQLAILEPKKAAVYTQEYIHISDSLQKVERNMGNKFTRIEYETDKIKDENSNLTEKNQKLVYIFSFVTILGLFLYIIKSQKAKNRELLYKQEQQHANEEIYNLMISQQNTIETNRVQEKKRVAQELHDGVLGRMFGVRMNLDGLNRYNDDLAIEQRNAYLSELKNIEQDIREISHDLNREKSELINNFVAIVDNLFEEQRKTFPSKLISNIDSNIKWEIIPNAIKINLFRIIQESLQNINKYAKASLIKVELRKQENDILLVINDNGVGFNANLKKKGIGLQNMQSRTKECNGTFNIQSKIGEGATVSVTVPIEQEQIPT